MNNIVKLEVKGIHNLTMKSHKHGDHFLLMLACYELKSSVKAYII